MKTQSIKGINYEVLKSSPVLESKTRHGQAKFWQGHIVYRANGKGHYFLTTCAYHETTSGKMTKVVFAVPSEVTPKNIGRANETTAEEQSQLEFDSMVKHQMDKGYSPKGVKSKVRPLPMLAQKFAQRAKYIKFPAYVQPKLDGMRMLFDGTTAWSRGGIVAAENGKAISLKAIDHLLFDTQGHTIDGELLLPDNPLLQVTARAAKKYKAGISEKLTYQVYDVVEPNMTFAERYELLKKLVKNAPKNVWLVKTIAVKSEEDVFTQHVHFTKAGYEGTIVRNANGKYTVGQRSNDLQKYKDFQDAEFKIVDVKEGNGSEKGWAIFVCLNKKGTTFNCRPEGDADYRRDLYKNRKKLIGKFLTVRYQTIQESGSPQFPVGVDVREAGEF